MLGLPKTAGVGEEVDTGGGQGGARGGLIVEFLGSVLGIVKSHWIHR